MSKFLRFGYLGILCALVSFAPANAARLYFTQSDVRPDGGAPIGQVPDITLDNPGDEITLHVWVDLESYNWMEGYGLDIVASNPGVFEAVSSAVHNPNLMVAGTSTVVGVRWGGGHGDPMINPNGSGAAELAVNGRGFSINPTGASGIFGDGETTKQGTFFAVDDPFYDATNEVWLAQSITLRALPGSAGQNTGLIMRVGENAFSLDSSVGVTPVFFGAGTTGVSNSNIGGTDGTMHAMLRVFGEPTAVGVTQTPHDGSDTSGDVVIDSARNTYRDAGGATSGRINIVNFLGDGSGDLPLFFDLVDGANAQQLVDDLNTAAGGEYSAALASFSAPNSDSGGTSTADIEIRYAGVPAGGSYFIDFDFGDVGVAAVGVPEPSSLALLGMSLVGLVGYGVRRRRSA